jgi:hypothetical protein
MPVIDGGREGGRGLGASFNDKKHSFLVLFLFFAMEYYCSFLKITKPLIIVIKKYHITYFMNVTERNIFYLFLSV